MGCAFHNASDTVLGVRRETPGEDPGSRQNPGKYHIYGDFWCYFGVVLGALFTPQRTRVLALLKVVAGPVCPHGPWLDGGLALPPGGGAGGQGPKDPPPAPWVSMGVFFRYLGMRFSPPIWVQIGWVGARNHP